VDGIFKARSKVDGTGTGVSRSLFAGLELGAFGNVIVEVEFEFLWRWVRVALTILKELARGR
jgi:hypothetical protein